MKTTQRGSLYTVTVSREEVATFKSRWPCSTLPDRAITFYFDRLSGDLIDITPYAVKNGADLLALSMDAQSAGLQALRELA